MHPLTFETLITCSPLFHVEILAGWEARKNNCQHVVLDQTPQEEDSFVLIHYPQHPISLVENSLKDYHCSGILLLSQPSCYIPASLLKMADDLKKPLFLLNHEHGENLLMRINGILHLHEQHLLSMAQNELTGYWLQLFCQKGLEHVIDRFNLFFGQAISLFTKKKKSVRSFPNQYSIIDLNHFEWKNPDNSNHRLFIIHNQKEEYYCFAMADSDQKTAGYLLFDRTSSPETLPCQLLDTITPTIMAWLKQIEMTNKIHLHYKEQFLFDILHNNIDTERELIELGLLRGMEFTPNAFVLSMNINSPQAITKDMVTNIQHLMAENHLIKASIFTMYLNHMIVAIVCPLNRNAEIAKEELNGWINQVQGQIKRRYPELDTKIGIGRCYYSNLAIHKSFQESKIALQMDMYDLGSNGVVYYEDIGYVRLLTYIPTELLKDFSRQYLGGLEKHDEEHGTDLLQTLSTYCAQNGDIARSAESLFIHQNTLRQRLKKIESILGIELSNYTNIVNLSLSLKISQEMNM